MTEVAVVGRHLGHLRRMLGQPAALAPRVHVLRSPTAILPTERTRLPETRYAKSGAVRIAYQVVGQGPLDLVFVPDRMSNLDVHWEEPGFSHLLHRLSAFARLILLDRRGSGLSDRIDGGEAPSLQTHVDDARAE